MKQNRRTHSSIDRLPQQLRDTITRMVVDNKWPADFMPTTPGTPRYEDVAAYCMHKGHVVSLSAVGRFGARMRMLAKYKQAGIMVRDVMKDLTAEKASETQKAVAEMITAETIDFIGRNESLSGKEIKDVAQAMRDCTSIAINADKYIRAQLSEKVKTAAKSTKDKLTKAGVDKKLIQEIIDEYLGVVKS